MNLQNLNFQKKTIVENDKYQNCLLDFEKSVSKKPKKIKNRTKKCPEQEHKVTQTKSNYCKLNVTNFHDFPDKKIPNRETEPSNQTNLNFTKYPELCKLKKKRNQTTSKKIVDCVIPPETNIQQKLLTSNAFLKNKHLLVNQYQSTIKNFNTSNNLKNQGNSSKRENKSLKKSTQKLKHSFGSGNCTNVHELQSVRSADASRRVENNTQGNVGSVFKNFMKKIQNENSRSNRLISNRFGEQPLNFSISGLNSKNELKSNGLCLSKEQAESYILKVIKKKKVGKKPKNFEDDENRKELQETKRIVDGSKVLTKRNANKEKNKDSQRD